MHELPRSVQAYFAFYRVRRYRETPWTPVSKPLPACRVALVTTTGVHLPSQPPFDETIKGGDWSYREIPDSVDVQTLRISHKSYAFDQTGAQRDINLVLPLDRLREMRAEGRVGTLNGRHFSFMGSISAPGRLIAQTAPAVAQLLRDDGVDVVLLTPA
ncbi:MAG: hypothetical protein HY710_10305 [Candidatus Latescibacteria bacterium]|nr:hypothetical protein [Candidatus Latescibacterota bacterium]